MITTLLSMGLLCVAFLWAAWLGEWIADKVDPIDDETEED